MDAIDTASLETRASLPTQLGNANTTKSRKCGCTLELIIKRARDGTWFVKFNGRQLLHNHKLSANPASHPTRRNRLRNDEVLRLIEGGNLHGERVAVTMVALRAEHPSVLITSRDVYNIRQRARTARYGNQTKMEFLMNTIRNKDMYFSDVCTDADDHTSKLFIAHKASLEVFKSNSDVLVMDCTYKTNRLDMPLLNIVGCTGMNTTIHVAQCFIRSEDKDEFEWALQRLRNMFDLLHIPLPQVIFSDRDEALLNALDVTRRDVPTLLCLWHIYKDVQAHVRDHRFHKVLDTSASTRSTRKYIDSEEHERFCKMFVRVTRSATEQEYELNLKALADTDQQETDHVCKTWLDIWKKRVVRCWTDKVTHFGLQTTSRVEGYHHNLKRWLCNSKGDLLTIIDRMNLWWVDSASKHYLALDDASISIVNSLRLPLYERMVRVIYNHALKQCVTLLETYQGSGQCSGSYRYTTGLPCWHVLSAVFETKKA